MFVTNVPVMLAVMWLFLGALGVSVAPREWRSILLPAAIVAGAVAFFLGAT
jgi:hypothetical protein